VASETERQAGTAWTSVLRTRQAGYPGARDLIRAAATDVVALHETGLILALARIGGYPCVLAAQDRHGPLPGPAALRVTQRAIRLADGLRLPLVTVIDTPGAELSAQAEEDGLAGEIANCLAALLAVGTPTISVLLGQGTGGAALALLPADRTIAAEHAWLAPLALEGASAIVYRDTSHAAELAARSQALNVGHERLQQFVADGQISPEALAILRARHQYRAGRLPGNTPDGGNAAALAADIRMKLIAAEREYIYQLLQGGQITDEARRRIERELDLEEASIARKKDGGEEPPL